MLISVFTQPRN